MVMVKMTGDSDCQTPDYNTQTTTLKSAPKGSQDGLLDLQGATRQSREIPKRVRRVPHQSSLPCPCTHLMPHALRSTLPFLAGTAPTA